MNDHVARLLQLLAADLAPTGLRLVAGVFDLAADDWIAGGGEVPRGFGHEGFAMVLPGRQHLLPEADSAHVDLIAMVDDVREWAMDELGHGWPELYDDDGRFVAVFQPVGEPDGVVWAADGHRVPVGQLTTARVAVPPRWDGTRA